jgi:hypothetical protein
VGRYLLRDLAFNAATIRLIWQPLLSRAERNSFVARFVRAAFYRGVIAHHFFRGCREGRTWTGAAQIEPRQA